MQPCKQGIWTMPERYWLLDDEADCSVLLVSEGIGPFEAHLAALRHYIEKDLHVCNNAMRILDSLYNSDPWKAHYANDWKGFRGSETIRILDRMQDNLAFRFPNLSFEEKYYPNIRSKIDLLLMIS